MLCQICKQNVATVKYTEIVEGKVTEIHVCQDCALKDDKEISPNFGAPSLANLSSQNLTMPLSMSDMNAVCTSCGQTYFDLVQSGQLGCPQCYDTFSDSLRPLLERAHNATQHIGKTPKGRSSSPDVTRIKLMKYRGLLQKAVRDERYEDAARLRDLIKAEEAAVEPQNSTGVT